MNRTIVFLLFATVFSQCFGQSLPKDYGTIQTKLFTGDSQNQMLIVAFGGSEGGNIFANEDQKGLRNRFHRLGFSFLSVGYFGDKGLPRKLDRISLNAVYDTIKNTSSRLKIDSNRILLIGASRGAELALNLAIRYNFMGVIALVPPSVSLPYANNKQSTSSWTYNDKEVPYLSLSYDQIKGNGWLRAIESELKNKPNVDSSSIKVENIKGYIFLSSAKNDELWPSEQMCNSIVDRLKMNNFKYQYEHVTVDGGHLPSKHWDMAFKFIEEQILKPQKD